MEEEKQDLYKEIVGLTKDGELDVGITEYLNEGNKIYGIFKYRMSDFIVNEVDYNTKKPFFYEHGKLDKQYEYIIEQEKLLAQLKLNNENPDQEKEVPVEKKIQDEDMEQAKKLFGEKQVEELVQFYSDWTSGEKKTFYEFTVPSPQEKDQRKILHEFVREKLPFFDSRTEDKNIKVIFTKNASKKKKFTSKQESVKKHYSFILHKYNYDTNSALNEIGGFLKLPTKIFGQAGIKDKRGYTTQRITINNLQQPIENIVKRLKSFKKEGILISNIDECVKPIKVGELYGNRFSIALRLIKNDQETIKTNLENLKNDGFINYFGMQRFGNNNTHFVGKYIFQQDYKKAVDKILFESQTKNNFREILKKYQENGDHKAVLDKLPRFLNTERTLIQGLSKSKDFIQCLSALPKNVRDLYPHAYQSYIWNKLASIRIKKYGKKLAIGDIVVKNKSQLMENNDEDDAEGDIKYETALNIDIEYINEENISKYTINDVLIPMVGASVKIDFDKFNLSQELNELLEQDNLSIKSIRKNTDKNFYVSGGYRILLFTAEDVEYKILNFNNINDDFLTPFYKTEEDKNVENGKHQALLARFTLKKGCYATMLMRELTKVSSSFDIQTQFNSYYRQQNKEDLEQDN